jgi:hypothetical protein
MSGTEPVGSKIGLGEGQRAAATAKPDRPVGKRGAERHALKTGDGEEVGAAPSKSEAWVTG